MKRVALKVQRRRYSYEALREIAIYQRLRERIGTPPEIIALHETFQHDGHICLAFDLHGNSLCEALERGPLTVARTRRAARQMFTALDRLHRSGYTHTDVKPDNILYRSRSGDARLADLGDAEKRLHQGTLYGTREYTPPEMILGAPLTPAIDVWSLGCTIYEMLTDRLLFDPRAAAARRYREFDRAAAENSLPLAASVIQDQADEEAEQLVRGTVLARKYRLQRLLGRGRFGTVWAAEVLDDTPLDQADELLRERRKQSGRKKRTKREREDRKWRRAKGAADLVDLALNFEQLLLIARLRGPFSPAMLASARYRASYLKKDGSFRFQRLAGHGSLRDRLRRQCVLRGESLTLATDFLQRCLTINPGDRLLPNAALAHPWLARD